MSKNNIQNLQDLNNKGVIGRFFSVDAPLLTDPVTLQEVPYPKEPLEIIDFKSLSNLSDADKHDIQTQLNALFQLSHNSFVEYQESILSANLLNSDNCMNPLLFGQYGVFTKVPIQKFQPVGIYSGIYATSYMQLEYIASQFDMLKIARFGNACTKGGLPVICGHYNGNYMSLVNDWRPFGWQNHTSEVLAQLRADTYNTSSIIAKSGEYFFIMYVSDYDISENVQLITDYGEGYWGREKELFAESLSS